jgi:hypothetical protein
VEGASRSIEKKARPASCAIDLRHVVCVWSDPTRSARREYMAAKKKAAKKVAKKKGAKKKAKK